jgi:hypothetical protein
VHPIQNFFRLGIIFCLGLAGATARAQNFSDDFANSPLLTGATATISDSNTNATLEPGEPRILQKAGGHSVWVAWSAPGNGLVTLDTAGSSFDTLLGVYVQEPGNDPPFQRLESVAANDDFGGLSTSQVQFGANTNQIYYISVDGFNGDAGDISFALNFLSSSNLQPTVLTGNGDRALRLGDPLILTVNFIPTSAQLDLQWYFNGRPILDADQPTLVIRSLQATNLGFYSLKFELNDDSFFSAPVEIQVNSEGQQKTLARYKIADAAVSGLTPATVSSAVNIGYNGTQIYNTTNAIVDPTAPLICGVPPGAAYWFAYTAPTNGVLSVDTAGSGIATLLAGFTYTGVLTSYTNLTLLACDNNNGGTGTNRNCHVQFSVVKNGNYFIVVGGVNGARGVVQLNYSLAAGLPPAPPVITAPPQGLVVSANTAVALSATATGTGMLKYQWWKNNYKLSAQTNTSLLLASPASSDAGNYFVTVTNTSGSVTSAPAKVTVISAPMTAMNVASNWLVSAFPATRGYQYKADCTATLGPGSWLNFTNPFPDYGGVIWLTNSTRSNTCLFLRVHTP